MHILNPIKKTIAGMALATALVGAAAGMMLVTAPTASARSSDDLEQRVATLEAKVEELLLLLDRETEARLEEDNRLGQRIDAETSQRLAGDSILGIKTQFISVVNGEMVLTGTNLRILNGMGSTGTTNGFGNLIVGYNENRFQDANIRTGSHNVVIGMQNNFSKYGGLVAGNFNTISGNFSCVLGGSENVASGSLCTVSGGRKNLAGTMLYASVSGGWQNRATYEYSSVTGGILNTAHGWGASVSGGYQRTLTGDFLWLGGGLISGP